MSFRKTIKREVKKRGLSGYALAKLVQPHISTRMIQAYLSGQADMSGEQLALVCEALGLQLTPRRKRR